MKQALFSICFIASALTAGAQTEVLSKIPSTGTSIADFIPKGYDTLQDGVAYGDLDKDGRPDVAMALYDKAEVNDGGSERERPLVVVFKTANGYKLAGKSAGAVMCKGCGGVYGDPFASIAIKNGILLVDHYGGSNWRWSVEDKYRYQNGGMYLIGTTYDSYFDATDCNGEGVGNASRDYTDNNWVTGDEEIIKTNDECREIKHLKRKNKTKPLVKLEAVKQES